MPKADIKDDRTLLYALRGGRRLIRTQGRLGSVWSVGDRVVARPVAEAIVRTNWLEVADLGLLGATVPQSWRLLGDAEQASDRTGSRK